EDRHGPGARPHGAACRRLADALADDQGAGEEGEERAPTEPPQGARDELLRGLALGGRVRFGKEWTLHEVEVVEQPDPRDAGEEMQPAEQKFGACAREERHRRPPEVGKANTLRGARYVLEVQSSSGDAETGACRPSP